MDQARVNVLLALFSVKFNIPVEGAAQIKIG